MAENGPFGAPFLTPKSFRRSLVWVPFQCHFPGSEAQTLFAWGPHWGVLGGGQKVYMVKSLWSVRHHHGYSRSFLFESNLQLDLERERVKL